jgi:ABC-type maltose transport system permease subunit
VWDTDLRSVKAKEKKDFFGHLSDTYHTSVIRVSDTVTCLIIEAYVLHRFRINHAFKKQTFFFLSITQNES